MKAILTIWCFFTLLNQSWAMDDQQMSQLLVGSWESVDDQQQAITGRAHMVYDFTYYANRRFEGTIAMTFPPAPGQATSGMVYSAGVWEIRDGNLALHTDQVNPPNFASLFPDSSAPIQFLDKNTWKFVGAANVARRIR
jgi:hypothetical protein